MGTRITSRLLPNIISILDEGHKTHAKAGAPCAAGRYTPFRRTCDALSEAVIKNPGLTMKEAIQRTQHHYSSDKCAVSSLLHWVQSGKVPGIILVQQGRRLFLYPEGFEIPNIHAPALPEWADAHLKTGA